MYRRCGGRAEGVCVQVLFCVCVCVFVFHCVCVCLCFTVCVCVFVLHCVCVFVFGIRIRESQCDVGE